MKNDKLIEVIDLTKKFPEDGKLFSAVDSISFSLNKGEILGILGPNGAGKTTTVQMLLGVLTPTSGTIKYFGQDFEKNRSNILQKVSYGSSHVRFPWQMTVSENLHFYAKMYGIPRDKREARIKKYLTLFGMEDLAHRETGALSSGQMTRLVLAKAFISEPMIVLLDEPTGTLDPDIAQTVRSFILDEQKEFGLSILVTSHNMDEVTQICNRALVLKKGQIIADDTPQNLASSVSTFRIHIITGAIDACVHFAEKHSYKYELIKNGITIITDEASISTILGQLQREGIAYSQLSIDKPTLEDYFISIARSTTNESE